jgi:sortase A
VKRSCAAPVALLVACVAGCGGSPRPSIESAAYDYAQQLEEGQAVGRLSAVRLHRSVRVLAGMSAATIARGPGWFSGSFLPGQHGLTYVAGLPRATAGRFDWVGRLRRGDRLVFALPYAEATYAVTGRRIVGDTDTSVLQAPRRDQLRLQASTTPPGPNLLIVSADLVSIRRAG